MKRIRADWNYSYCTEQFLRHYRTKIDEGLERQAELPAVDGFGGWSCDTWVARSTRCASGHRHYCSVED